MTTEPITSPGHPDPERVDGASSATLRQAQGEREVVDELLAAYADDPASLSVAERAAVEARCLAEPAAAAELAELRALLAELRAHGDVADAGPDWAALEAGIRAAVTPATRRLSRWVAGAGLALAAAAGLALWVQHRRAGDGPGLDLDALVAATRPGLPAPSPSEPVASPDHPERSATLRPAQGEREIASAELKDELAALDDGPGHPERSATLRPAQGEREIASAESKDDLGGGADDDDSGDLGSADDEAMIGRALEPVPAANGEDGLFPGLDTDWIDDLSAAEIEQALRWLDQQGAG